MLKSLSLGGSVALLATAGFAQQGFQVKPVPGQVKDAGTLNLATGTWTRTQHDTGAVKVLYNNDANTGFYGTMSSPMDWTMDGRLPGTADASLPNAKSDAYTVTGFQVAYCFSNLAAGNTQNYTFYDAYAACTNPAGLTPVAAFTATGLPGSSAAGVTACWIVTFDLSGSTLEFGMTAEADGIFDADPALDNFGFTFNMSPTVSGAMGPLLNGDPNNFPAGDGTYYQNPGSTGSGLGGQDQFWLFDPGGAVAAGCYWFGGYPANPYSNWWLQVSGENADGGGDNCTKYCQANPNSTGSPASITSNCNFSGSNLTVTSQPVPNQPGIFFHALNQASLAFGNGFLCATGNIVRTGVVVGSGNQASRTIDFSSFSGTTRQTQYWYRDPAGGGAFFNTSNAITVDVP